MHGYKFDLNMYVCMITISYCDYQYGVTNVYRVTCTCTALPPAVITIVIYHYCNYFNVWI